jgi:hypothetical protein
MNNSHFRFNPFRMGYHQTDIEGDFQDEAETTDALRPWNGYSHRKFANVPATFLKGCGKGDLVRTFALYSTSQCFNLVYQQENPLGIHGIPDIAISLKGRADDRPI